MAAASLEGWKGRNNWDLTPRYRYVGPPDQAIPDVDPNQCVSARDRYVHLGLALSE